MVPIKKDRPLRSWLRLALISLSFLGVLFASACASSPLEGATSFGPFEDGLAPVLIGDPLTGKWGFVDHWGRIAIPSQFDSALTFSEGLAAVETGDSKWGYIDRSGRFQITPQFEEGVSSFPEGLAT